MEVIQMNLLGNVPLHDWIAVGIGLIGVILSWLQSKDRLPKWARKWLNLLGHEKIKNAIEYAEKLAGLTAEQKRQAAAAYLIRLSEKELGFPIPDSIANLLVEFVYQQWKRQK
jgi:hypothetical protein